MLYRYISFIALIILCFACGSAKKSPKPDFEIKPTITVVDNDTISINELRFYKIKTAKDAIRMMNEHYGNAHKTITGKHQDNIQREIWENILLFENDNTKFTIIADGAETRTDYYACLMIFDSEGNNCLNPEHPYRESIIRVFNSYMTSGN